MLINMDNEEYWIELPDNFDKRPLIEAYVNYIHDLYKGDPTTKVKPKYQRFQGMRQSSVGKGYNGIWDLLLRNEANRLVAIKVNLLLKEYCKIKPSNELKNVIYKLTLLTKIDRPDYEESYSFSKVKSSNIGNY